MSDMLNLCGVQVAGDLNDGKWHLANFQCALVPDFGFFVRRSDEYKLQFTHGTNTTTVDLGWTCKVRCMQEVAEALGRLINLYMRLAIEQEYEARYLTGKEK